MDEDLEAELREQFAAAGLDEDSIDEVLTEITPALEGE
jgi:SOS response regulatory protein OraA/RecX